MKENGVQKVKSVWEIKNKIVNPNIKENLLEIVDYMASFFSAGEFYYFVFNFETIELQFVKGNIKKVLGVDPNSFTFDYLFANLHPEDVEKIHEKELVGFDFLLNHIATEDIPLYKVIYLLRLKHTNGEYKTILHQSRAINVSKGGKVQQILCVQTDITFLNSPMDHRMSFISDKRPSYYAVETKPPYQFLENKFNKLFTRREKQIIKETSKGKTYIEIAEILQVSPHTINTHKKNILKKSSCKTTAELITKCIRNGVI